MCGSKVSFIGLLMQWGNEWSQESSEPPDHSDAVQRAVAAGQADGCDDDTQVESLYEPFFSHQQRCKHHLVLTLIHTLFRCTHPCMMPKTLKT